MPKYAALIILAALGLLSCSESYTYVPATKSNAVVSGVLAADYPVPSERGDIRLATIGVEDLHHLDVSRTAASVLHLRMLAFNPGPGTWRIDEREQRLDLTRFPAIHAGHPGSGEQPAIVDVLPGTRHVLDLYFALPPSIVSSADCPRFDVTWTVHTPSETIERRTPFERVVAGTVGEDDEDVTGRWGGSSSPSR
jgi:hypothetical protein